MGGGGVLYLIKTLSLFSLYYTIDPLRPLLCLTHFILMVLLGVGGIFVALFCLTEYG